MRIVVIEPERLAGKVLEFVLTDAGHEVVVAATAAAAGGRARPGTATTWTPTPTIWLQ